MALNAEINKTLALPDIRKRFSDFGLTSLPGPPEDLELAVRLDRQRYGALIKSLGLTPD